MDTLENRLQKRMHVSLYALLFLTALLGLSVLLEGCAERCETTEHFTYFEPVYVSHEEIRQETRLIEPQPIRQVGKLYRKSGYLFINEPGKGIHIIDNSDPSLPKVKSFLNIPGNYDLAIKDNILYADSYADLVAFDISSMSNVREVNRLTNVFGYFSADVQFSADPEKGIITSWEERSDVRVTRSDCGVAYNNGPIFAYGNGIAANDAAFFRESLALTPGNGSGPGVGGSMARFTVSHNHLYTLSSGNIQPFDVTNAASPVAKEKRYVAWDIETIFPYGKNLFLGARGGMHIFDISDPGAPAPVSTYQHVRSCDPVVVDGTHAFVTLRSGTTCEGFNNQLDVINIENLAEPKLVRSYPMENPHGLGIDNNTLFICDGDAGLKVYDAADVSRIDANLVSHFRSINAFDVIPLGNVLVMIGADGIFQYDYSDKENIRLLSQLTVVDGN